MIPVYLGANRNFMPGIMYETEEKFEVCTGVNLEDTEEGPKVVYDTLTVTRGIPREISLDEALLRYFLGRENMKIISRKLTSYKAQREAFSKLLKQVKYNGPLLWCTWDFMGDTPLLILEVGNLECTLLTSIRVCSRGISKQERVIKAVQSIIKVDKRSLKEIDHVDVLKYYWCGEDTLKYLVQHNMPLKDTIDTLWKNMF